MAVTTRRVFLGSTLPRVVIGAGLGLSLASATQPRKDKASPPPHENQEAPSETGRYAKYTLVGGAIGVLDEIAASVQAKTRVIEATWPLRQAAHDKVVEQLELEVQHSREIVDRETEAYLCGKQEGFQQGREKGLEEAMRIGLEQGREEGKQAGFNDATQAALRATTLLNEEREKPSEN